MLLGVPSPFRNDAVFREERAAALRAEQADLARTLADAEWRIRAARRARLAPWLGKVRSVIGAWFIVVALVGGYAVGRFVVGTAAHECR